MTRYLLINIILISFGGLLGTNIRYIFITRFKSKLINQKVKILFLNLISSFILGLSYNSLLNFNLSSDRKFLYSFLFSFIGSLSTFSTFVYDMYKLALNKKYKNLIILVLTSIILGLLFFCIGFFYLNY